MTDVRYYHGGIPGLREGDVLEGGNSRPVHDGCAICQLRAAGVEGTIDPVTKHQDRVYITTDKEYARFYASLYGRGDLYLVRPIGDLVESEEDHFSTWHVEAAEVLRIYDRYVLLTRKQRRRMYKRWIQADTEHARRLAEEAKQ